MKGSMAPPPMSVEAKLRQVAAACDVQPGGDIGEWPAWFLQMIQKDGTRCWHDLLKEAADELEQRSILAGKFLAIGDR